jgi:UDP-N-acetyl-D-mannosaminuronate dehydrogenase
VPTFDEDGHHFESVPLTEQSITAADCVMIVTDHTSLDYDLIRRHARCIVDTRNALARSAAR